MRKQLKGLLTQRPKWSALMMNLDYETHKLPIFQMMGYEPHPAQEEIHRDNSRVRCVCCGRRFGKSLLAAAEAVVCAILGGGVWAVAPDYDLSSVVFEEALAFVLDSELASQLAGEPRIARGRQTMVFKSGGWILGKSTHKPRSLLGRGLDLVVDDEAATEDNPAIWHQYIRPVLIDRIGAFLPISTPRGDNWFKEIFDKGDLGVKGYRSWQLPTSTNPTIKPHEFEELIADYPKEFLEQEIYAQFLADTGALFRGFKEVCTCTQMLERGIPGRVYVAGVDLARKLDYTVICVLDAMTGTEVYMERMNNLDWPYIESRIQRVAKLFNCGMVVDATGPGDRTFRALEDLIDWVPLEPFIFSNASKLNVMNQLAIAIQDHEVAHLAANVVVPDPDGGKDVPLGKIAMSEMANFRYMRTPSGKLTMSAPLGKHDDIVVARALALEAQYRFVGRVEGAGAMPGGGGGGSREEEEGGGGSMVGRFGSSTPAPEGSAGRNFGGRHKRSAKRRSF